MSTISAAVLLFLVLDPVGNIPLFMVGLKNVAPEKHVKIIFRESLIGLGFLLLFLFLGRYILAILHVSQSSLSIAGGIILFLIAIKMIFTGGEDVFGLNVKGEPFIVPLAVPLIAGPSAMAVVLLMMAREPHHWPRWLLAVILAWLMTTVILLFSAPLKRALHERGLTALERLMGMILTIVSVQMFLDGIQTTFQ
jgi:MarC family membrane protein